MFFQGVLLETDGQNQYKQYKETKMLVTQPYCTRTNHGTQHMNTYSKLKSGRELARVKGLVHFIQPE
jgi:hypothetical protein